jgi:hypothetical protein
MVDEKPQAAKTGQTEIQAETSTKPKTADKNPPATKKATAGAAERQGATTVKAVKTGAKQKDDIVLAAEKQKSNRVVEATAVEKNKGKKNKAVVVTKTQRERKESTTMATEKQTKEAKKKGALLKETVADIQEVQKVVKSAINQGSKSIAQVHQAVAKLPLKYLGKFEKLKVTTKKVSDIQEKTIDHFYDLVQSVNDNIFDVSKDVVGLAVTE